jgi:hypothetical protein
MTSTRLEHKKHERQADVARYSAIFIGIKIVIGICGALFIAIIGLMDKNYVSHDFLIVALCFVGFTVFSAIGAYWASTKFLQQRKIRPRWMNMVPLLYVTVGVLLICSFASLVVALL